MKETLVMCKQLKELKQILGTEESDTPKSLAIMTHPNPDPDCIGAAKGFEKLVKSWAPETNVTILYDGEVSHPQNRTLLKVLNINMTHREEIGRQPEDLKNFADCFVVIDVMPERCEMDGIKPDMVVDHHPVDTQNAKAKDIRQVGSCCTLVWEYLKHEEIEFDEKSDDDGNIATAMLIGIKTDTMDMIAEKVTDLDFQAFKDLLSKANRTKLASIINYPIPSYLFELRGRLDGEGNCVSQKGIYIGGIGYILPGKRDALPTIAEERARTEGVDTAFIFAVVGNHIEVCIRSNSPSVDVKTLCHQIFGKEHGGGHPRAGAVKIPLPFLSSEGTSNETKESLWLGIRNLIIEKIVQEMERI